MFEIAEDEITEDEIARAIALELAAFRKRMFPDSKVDLLPSEMAQAAGILIAVVQPALERARREERERLFASAASSLSELLTARYMDEPWYSGVVAMHDALAAAIRKG